MSIVIFVSYADVDKDERVWKALEANLLPLYRGRSGKIQLWNPHKNIIPGFNRKRVIDDHLQNSHVFLALLSPDYFADPECERQMRQALLLESQERDRMYVIPVLLRPCIWQRVGLDTTQILPQNKVPISRWSDRDEVLVQVAGEIYNRVDLL